MLKSFSRFFAIALFGFVFFFSTNAEAQLTPGSFGINASFSSDWDEAGLCYTLSEKTELGVSLTYNNTGYSYSEGTAPDSETILGFNAYFAYYLSKGDVNPFVSVSANMINYPEENGHSPSHLGLEFSFGAQTFLTKGFAIYGEIGVGYSIHSHQEGNNEISKTNMSLFTSAIGATFYF